MLKYLHVVGIGIQNTLTYRFNFLMRSVMGLVPLMGVIYLWRAVYFGEKNGAAVAGYSLAGMTSYYLLVMIVDALTAVTDDDWQIAADIKDGNISQFLLKPIDFLTYRLCIFVAGRMVYTVVAAAPLALFIWWLRKDWVWPANWTTLGLSLFSLALTGILQFFVSYTLALLAFWVMEVSTFIFIAFAFEYIAGGHLFPLNILPGFWNDLLAYTPFPYLLYFPVSIYLGQTKGDGVWRGLLIQTLWVLAAYGLARLVWARGIRKYGAAGG